MSKKFLYSFRFFKLYRLKSRILLRIGLSLQLALSPVYSFPQSPPNAPSAGDSVSKPLSPSSEGGAPLNGLSRDFLQTQVETAEEFNKKVQTLNQHIFGPRDLETHYKDHPLDFYSLIGQKVEMQRAGFWEKHNPWYQETKQAGQKIRDRWSETKESAEDKVLSMFDSGPVLNQTEATAEPTLKQVETTETEKNQKPFWTEIKPENLMVNIVVPENASHHSTDSTEEKPSLKPQEIIVARINSQGDKIRNLAYGGPRGQANFDSSEQDVARGEGYHKAPVNMPQYTGKSFVVSPDSQELYSFNISYQGQVLHRFSNHIQWMSFVGPYLVFMEPSRIYKKKIELSFIDLSYFHLAIGKTALPVFHIPLALKSQAQKKALSHPLEINLTEDSLTLKGQNAEHSIAVSHINEMSRIQQVHFNILVSMLSTDKYERDMLPFFKEIATKFEEILNSQEKKGGNAKPSNKVLKQVLVEVLKNRVDIGSPLHHAGHYGAVKASQHRIKSQIEKEQALLDTITQAEQSIRQGAERDPETERLLEKSRQALSNLNLNDLDKETYNRSVKHLETDQAFQTALKEISDTKFARRAVLDRLKGLWVYLTLPQPLGAPKIQEALGLMANAVRPGETVQERFLQFSESLKQLVAHPKVRFVGIPVLAGMASLAAPETADFFRSVFSVFRSSMEVFAATGSEYIFKYIPAFLNPLEWSRAYVEDGNIGPFTKGIGAVGFAMLLFYYAFHIPVNIKKFVDYLKTEKAKNHANEVLSHLTNTKRPSYFKNWAEHEQNTYYRDLAVGEFKNVGLPVTLSLADGSKISLALQTVENVSNLISDFKNPDFNINVEVQINEGEEVLRFSSVGEKGQASDMTLDISPQPAERAIRSFFLKQGYLTDMFQDGQLVENVFIEITGDKPAENKTAFLYKAKLIGLHFTKQEMGLLQEALTGTKYQAIYDRYVVDPVIRQAQKRVKEQGDFAENTDHLSNTEISFLKSGQIFFFSFPSFNNTQKVMNPTWNVWFLIRSLWFTVLYPHRLATLVFFSNYFDRVYGEMHQATSLNGGFRLRGTELVHKTHPTGREYLSALKEFEKEIIQVERRYLRAASEWAYLQALKDALQEDKPLDFLLNEGIRKQLGNFNFLPSDDPIDKNNPKLSLRDGRVSELYQAIVSFNGAPKDKLSRQDSLFIELYQNKLFEESIRSYMKAQLGMSNQASDREVLKQVHAKIKAGERVAFRSESLDEIRDRVRAVSAEKNIAQKMKENMASWHKAFFEKLKVQHNRNMSNMLNPRKNLQMERFHVSKVLGKDPEAMARATRYSMVGLIIDRPIELFILLAMMAGVSDGILKMLYSEPFNERAFFYMSAYLVWAEFFIFTFVLNTLSASWDKLQIDSRSAFQSAFDKFPNKEDLNKRFSALKYFWQRGFGNKDLEGKIDVGKINNTLWENYKFSTRIIVSNFAAAFPTLALGFGLALERFDFELFLGGYISILLLGLYAILLKVEGIYELSSGYAARELIRKGIDIKKFAHHPVVQQILLKRAFKDRIIFNLINAIAINNILENSARIVENLSASDGARSIHRAFFKEGHLFTEYWGKMTDSTQKIFSTASQLCKRAFTNNRLDIGGE